MRKKKAGNIVIKSTPEEEERMKNEAFLKLKPKERLRIHEELRRRIWKDQYNKLSLKGLKVIKRPMPS